MTSNFIHIQQLKFYFISIFMNWSTCKPASTVCAITSSFILYVIFSNDILTHIHMYDCRSIWACIKLHACVATDSKVIVFPCQFYSMFRFNIILGLFAKTASWLFYDPWPICVFTHTYQMLVTSLQFLRLGTVTTTATSKIVVSTTTL